MPGHFAGTGTMNKWRTDDSSVAECREQGGVWCKICWSFKEGPNPWRSYRLKWNFSFREMRSHSKDSSKELWEARDVVIIRIVF